MFQLMAQKLGFYLGLLLEGPVWDPRGFWMVADYLRNRVLRVYPDGQVDPLPVKQRVASVMLTAKEDWYLITQLRKMAYFNPTLPEAKQIVLLDYPKAPKGQHQNDWSVVSPDEAFGGAASGKGDGWTYNLRPNGDYKEQFGGNRFPNGHWLHNGRMYFIDSQFEGTGLKVRSFGRNVVDDFTMADCRVEFELEPPPSITGIQVVPDGAKQDIRNNIWIAWNGAGVARLYAPTGQPLGEISCRGASEITNICLGGEDMRTALIVSANERTKTDRHLVPLNGGMFVCRVEVPGKPAIRFAGHP